MTETPTTLIQELEQAALDADLGMREAGAAGLRTLAAAYDERAHRLRARAERVREITEMAEKAIVDRATIPALVQVNAVRAICGPLQATAGEGRR